MALVYVGGNTGTWAGATAGNNNVSLTALTGGIAAAAAAGDFVVAVYATGSAADRTLVIQDPSAVAYTLIDVERYANGTTYDSNLRVAFKRLTAADANVVFGPTGNAQDAGAAAIHVWRGVNTATPQDVTAVGTSGTGTGRPNPPAITPTTAGAVVIATGGAAAATGAVFVGTGLSNFRTATSVDTNDGMVGIGSFAWTSGAYDPAAWTGGTANAADSWTSITLVLRPGATQTLTPTLFTNTQTFFSPDVTQSGAAQTLTPSLYTNTQTFHNPTVSATYGLTPALYTNDQAFFSADVTQAGGAQALTPSLYTNTQTFFSPTAAATYALTPALYSNGQTFFSPTVTATRTLTPALYTNTQSFFAPTVTASKTLTAALFTNTQSFFAPTVTATYSLTPAKYDNNQTFYSAVITQTGGAQTLLPGLYTNEQTFFAPTVGRGAVTLQPGLVTNNQTFYAATATASYTIAPDLAVNAQTFYAPTVTQAAPGQTLAPDLYTNTQAFYSPTVAPGAVTLLPQGYVDDGYVSPGYVGPNTFSTQAFFAPAVTTSKTLTPSLLTNASSFYAPTVALESYLITKAQALSLYKVWLLQGLAPQALTVAPSSRSAGGVSQSITQVDDTVTVSTTASPTAVGADPGTMIDEIALLHGLGSDLVVTPLARSAGAISQTLATTGSTTTVTRV
jgi:hypothetical protein